MCDCLGDHCLCFALSIQLRVHFQSPTSGERSGLLGAVPAHWRHGRLLPATPRHDRYCRTHTHTHTHTNTHTHTHTHTNTHTHTHTQKHTCAHTHTCMCVAHVCVCPYARTHAHTHAHTHMNTCTIQAQFVVAHFQLNSVVFLQRPLAYTTEISIHYVVQYSERYTVQSPCTILKTTEQLFCFSLTRMKWCDYFVFL